MIQKNLNKIKNMSKKLIIKTSIVLLIIILFVIIILNGHSLYSDEKTATTEIIFNNCIEERLSSLQEIFDVLDYEMGGGANI
jgi:flagellar biosynthesis/type III secretory pathway M-ring protein FliF/YscJ